MEINGGFYNSSSSSGIADLDLPYKVHGVLEFRKGILIADGVTMEFGSEGGILVDGGLTIGSSSGDPVELKGASAGAGQWKGIKIYRYYASSSGLFAYNTTISGAGSSPVEDDDSITAAVYVRNGNAQIDNVTVEETNGIGVIAHYVDATDCSFSNNKEGCVKVSAEYLHQVIDASKNNTFSSWPSAATIIVGEYSGPSTSSFSQDITLPNYDGSYDFLFQYAATYVPDGTTLTIEKAAYIQFDSGTSLVIDGSIQAIGGADADKIYLTGKESTVGLWGGLKIRGTASSELQYVSLEYAGGDSDQANLYINNIATDVTVTNCGIINSAGYAVVSDNASVSAINDPGSNNTLGGDMGGYQEN